MSVVTHRWLDGTWALCEDPDTCESRLHFPDVTPEEMALVPMPVLLELATVLDPPQHVIASRQQAFHKLVWRDAAGLRHRDYDLPAVIYPEGDQQWWRHGQRHRDNMLPALVTPEGDFEWWVGSAYLMSWGGPGESYMIKDGTFEVTVPNFPTAWYLRQVEQRNLA